MGHGDTRERGPVDGGALEGHLVDNRYLVVEKIARGGMATVYRATDTRLDRTVALKVMHSSLGDDEEFVSRFVREARAAARLSHPHVVGVHDQGWDGGLVYLVMEHLPGRTLRDVVRDEAPLPPGRALRLLEPVLSALTAAHAAGIVHRDVKPENVLIGSDGSIKVADFGLAKAVSAETSHTATSGVLIGTVSYLAPELLSEGVSDTRADVYAAGVVLHELLTGFKPHRGETPIQIAYHHVHTDVPLPSAAVPGIPPYLDALVARACVRDPGQRPADAGVLRHHLRRVAQAVDAGVRDDPELDADLRPQASLPVTLVDAPPVVHTLGDPGDGGGGSGGSGGSGGTWFFGPDRGTGTLESSGRAEPPVAIPRPPGSTRERPPEADRSRGPGWAPPSGPPPVRPGSAGEATAGRRRGRGPWIVLAVVVALALLAGGVWWFGVARYTSAPGVIGLSEADAVDRIEAAGLDAEVDEPAYSESVPAGEVLSADPGGGDRLLDGGTVTIVVSLGPERYDVPTLRGELADDAQDALLELDLEVGEAVEQYSDSIEEGDVIGSDPQAGTAVRPGSVVSLVISLGPEPITLEDLTGTDADAAEERYADEGVSVELLEEPSADVAAGDVIAQDPAAGTELFPGDTLTLTVSTGTEDVVIPDDIVGSSVTDAREQLEDLDLLVVVDDDDALGLGVVTAVEPGEGEAVEAGSEVTLTVL